MVISTQEWHDQCNQQLEIDERFEAKTEQELIDLYHNYLDS